MGNADIGIRLRQAREKAGLTQKGVCEKLGIPKAQTISAYESGTNNPPIDRLGELAILYGVSTDWLILGTKHNTEQKKTSFQYAMDLVSAAEHLGLTLCTAQEKRQEYDDEDGEMYEYEHQYIAIRSDDDNSPIGKLLADWQRIYNIKNIIGESDYDTLLKKRIAEYYWPSIVDLVYGGPIIDTADSDLPF